MSQAFKLQTKNENFEVNFNKLDDSQRAAVEASGNNVVIRAAAGSGKTSTLITAIAAYRYERLNDRICAITYTRAARAEMEERLHSMGIFDVEVTTIHVWARNLLNDLSVKYDFKVRVLEEMDIKTILDELVSEYKRRSGTRTKINIGILYSYITGNKNMDITDGYRRTLNTLELHYIQYKRDNNLYDFTDYPLYLYDVMTTYDEYIRNIDALFVDEFQDVDSTQFEIFEKVLSKKKFYIGDAWQSIFQFRGADGAVFTKLEDFDLYKLDYNYRSYQEIINYACTVYEELKPRIEDDEECYITSVNFPDESPIVCNRGYGGTVTIIDPFGNGNRIKNKVNYYMNTKKQKEVFDEFIKTNPMILCRTNKQVKAIQEFGYTNVSTVHQAKGLEYDNVIVVDTTIRNMEDLNIAYVALTRARDNMLVINWSNLEQMWLQEKSKPSGFGWNF